MRFPIALLPCLGVIAGVTGSDGSAIAIQNIDDIQQTLYRIDWADRIWKQIQGVSSCSGCQGLLLTFKNLAKLGDKTFVHTLQNVCKKSKVEEPDVCEGTIELQGPIIAEALRNVAIGSKTAQHFCVTFLGLCQYPAIEEWDVPLPPDRSHLKRPVPSGQDPIKVVHYSDIHVDQLYTEGSNAKCNKPICCRQVKIIRHTHKSWTDFSRPFTENDEPGKTDSPAGPFGEHTCDSPVSLEHSMYQAIKEIVPDASFTIFTGDVVDHSIWNTTWDYNKHQIIESYENMDKHLGIVYGTAGNHESHPTNAYQPSSIGGASSWIYDLLAGAWSRWIGHEAASKAAQIGAYSTKFPHGNLRVISLNTNLYYRGNFWLFQRKMIRDPSKQFDWLIEELHAAEKAGERVYIIGHMPPGDRNAFHDQSNYLNQIVNRYSSTIAAMFFGHTHRDHFQITYSEAPKKSFSNALLTSYVGPSLTPTSGMPSFRVYDVDPITFAVLDATTYSADMNSPTYQTQGPVWKKYYSAKETYGPLTNPPLTDPKAELTAAFWHNITEVFEKDQTAFDNFMLRLSRGWKQPVCEDECRKSQICLLRAARSQDGCDVPTLGSSYHTRMEDSAERDECGISVIQATFSALVAKEGALRILQELLVGLGVKLYG
ncbi:unnamed protein product [Fusarium graminearum]|uniref:Sphingomyelin phosphodiesterase n=3 Tax=Fusarium sambucinum species complex TaxID=569360 RepID=A0A0E0SE71_GIBZE|nr:hypothetical protein FG05_07002 [Fusarium graminearum]KAF5239186.1 hypothetical protein FAUST_5113 [Fusarium austroamericanum]KAI6766617.1 hypothetical protein HG531_011839 [Fusarium graminearum]PCD19539.1 hypothetical protein FGRA07_05288 [Fusarium graminearum]CAF3441417.1 unnamed protein product [Fusarium graminearum]